MRESRLCILHNGMTLSPPSTSNCTMYTQVNNKLAPSASKKCNDGSVWQKEWKHSPHSLPTYAPYIDARTGLHFQRQEKMQFNFSPQHASSDRRGREWTFHKIILPFNVECDECASDDMYILRALVTDGDRGPGRHHYISESKRTSVMVIQFNIEVAGSFFRRYFVLFHFFLGWACRVHVSVSLWDGMLLPLLPLISCPLRFQFRRCWMCTLLTCFTFCIIYSRQS